MIKHNLLRKMIIPLIVASHSMAVAQNQSILLPFPGDTDPATGSKTLNFLNSSNPSVITMPRHSFSYSGQPGNPHDEGNLHAPPSNPSNLYLFNEKYLGQHPKYAQTIVHDKEGNILFFIIDNNIYNRNGESFTDIATSSTAFLHEEFWGIDRWDRFSWPDGYTSLDPEIAVFPIQYDSQNEEPACYKFGIVYSFLNRTTQDEATWVYYRTLTYYDEDNIFLSEPIDLGGYFKVNFFQNKTWCCDGSARNIAVCDWKEGKRLLFVRLYYKVFIIPVNIDGSLDYSSITDNEIITDGQEPWESASEMEVIHIGDDIVIGMGYCHNDGISNTTALVATFIWDYSSLTPRLDYPKWCYLPKGTQQKEHIKGLEFDNYGNLYVTYTGQEQLFFVTSESYTAISSPPNAIADYQYSEIEMGRDGYLYYLHSNGTSGGIDRYDPINANWEEVNPTTINKVYFSHDYTYSTDYYSKILLFEDQIDGSDYTSFFDGISQACCNDHIYFSVWPEDGDFVNNPIWQWEPGSGNSPFPCLNGTVWINEDVTIPSGSKLTIKDMKFKFSGGKKLKIEQGATLILDNTILTSVDDCSLNELWGGIEVLGTPTDDQFILSNQGKLVMINNSRIENSICGVSVGSYDNSQACIGDGGGIVHASNSEIRNCARGVRFAPYSNIMNGQEYNNFSRFLNCIFRTTDEFYEKGYSPDAFVNLEGVSGIYFKGCDFINADATHLMNSRGNGIVSKDSRYYVTGNCTSIFLPCPSWDRSKFQGLEFGIRAENTYTTDAVSIRNTDFINNFRAVSLYRSANCEINDCSFDVGENSGPENSTHEFDAFGIYMESCTGYLVQGNTFTTSHSGRYGLIVANSGSAENKINNNSFSNFKYAVQAEGRNRSPVIWGTPDLSTGLVFRCNEFSDNQVFDIGLTPFTYPGSGLTITGSIKNQQGSCGTQVTPAGNTFLTEPLYNLFSKPPVLKYIYSYHGLSPQTQPTVNSPLLIHLNPCSVFWGNSSCVIPSPGNISALMSTLSQRSMQIDSLSEIFDNGSTQAMLNVVTNPSNSSQTITTALMAASPYVTDTVLVATIHTGKLTPAHTKEVFVANSPLTEPVLIELTKVSLPPGIRKQILNAQTGTSARAILEENLSSYQSELTLATDELLRYYLNDTISTGTDSIIAFFSTVDNARSKEILAQAYLNKQDCANALSTLGQIQQTSDEETRFVEYYSILADLCSSGKDIDSLTSGQIQDLQEIAASGTMVSVGARIILARLADSTISETIEDIVLPDSLKVWGYLTQNTDCGSSAVAGDTLVLKDYQGNIVNGITPAITDSNGKFEFDPLELLSLGEKYCIATKSSFTIDTTVYNPIDIWRQSSPVNLELTSVAQIWQSEYNSNELITGQGQSLMIQGGIYSLGGVITTNGNKEIVVVKNDPVGNIVWTSRFDPGFNGKGEPVGFYIDSAQYIYCLASDGNSPEFSITRIDSNGVKYWTRLVNSHYTSCRPTTILGDNQSSLYVCGAGYDPGHYREVFNMKCDTTATQIWGMANQSSSGDLFPGDFVLLPSGLLISAAVDTNSAHPLTQVIAITDSATKVYMIKVSDVITETMINDDAGNVYLFGNQSNISTQSALAKLNSQLTLLWKRPFNGYSYQRSLSDNIAIDSLGNIMVLTQFDMGFILTKIGNDATTTYWQRPNKGSWYHFINKLDMTMDRFGNVYIGITDEFKEAYLTNYVFLYKYDTDGNLNWSTSVPRSMAADVSVSENLNVYISGSKLSYPNNQLASSMITHKFSQCFSSIDLRAMENNQTQDQSSEYFLNLYPNPNDGAMEISYRIPEEEQGLFEIYDQTGRVVYSKRLESGTQSVRLQTEGLKSGVYFYRAFTSVRSLVNDRVVIIK